MWRREERLEYWLAGGPPPEKTGPAAWLWEKLRWKLGLFSNAVREHPLHIETNAISLDAALDASTGVLDGLGELGKWSMDAANALHISLGTMSVQLMDAPSVRTLRLPNEQQARIQQAKLELNPNAQSLPTGVGPAAVRRLEFLKDQLPEVRTGDRWLLMNPGVGTLMSRISRLPHMQLSVDVEMLKDSERKTFLREAEVIKRIPTDRADLLAVFRHVPIEVISRLRYLAEKKIILYSISSEPRRTHTRVHDMAAVRDTASQEIHLVPHRTRFRSVSLN